MPPLWPKDGSKEEEDPKGATAILKSPGSSQVRTPVRIKIQKIEQASRKEKVPQPSSKRKKCLEPGPDQSRIHNYFRKVSKAEARDLRISESRKQQQGATCGPLRELKVKRPLAQHPGGRRNLSLRYVGS